MRKLILATVSVLALGLAGSGAGLAAQTGNSAQLPSANTPSTNMPATGQSSPPTATMQNRMQSTAPKHLSQTQMKQVQQKLEDAGLYKGKIDGRMGPDTRQAIEQFQQQNGLQKTGRIDQQTLAALNLNNNSGTTGEGTSTLPSNQPGTANGLNNNGTSGSSTMPGNEPSNAGTLNNGSNNPNLQPGMNGTQPGASGNLNPATNPNH